MKIYLFPITNYDNTIWGYELFVKVSPTTRIRKSVSLELSESLFQQILSFKKHDPRPAYTGVTGSAFTNTRLKEQTKSKKHILIKFD